ncbi:MAG: anti-phage dCTP deaminase [Isosphaeraceae bacterium]|nr:anti-phage dCTP deaminase [Isosphaeraceae bacterium]
MLSQASNDLNSELIIGIVSAVGADKTQVIQLLRERLYSAGYDVRVVKVSSEVIPLFGTIPAHGNDNHKKISDLMDAGNRAREQTGDDSILALGVATQIVAIRPKDENDVSLPFAKTAVIVDSLKRPEEVEKLRSVYPAGFILVGVHEEVSRRLRHLIQDQGLTEDKAEQLIRRDAEESKVKHGQRVNKTFHLADFFVRVSDSHDHLRGDIKRMVELWFGNPHLTPTFDEYAMFFAFAAALRSADLSRQVGAVVTKNDQILSTGANDCPKAGGGLYWPVRSPTDGCIGDIPNGRDCTREDGDSNRAEQVRIIEQIVSDGSKPEYALDAEKLRALLGKSVIRDLTEYGRVVHAEMEALLSCSRNGLSTVGTTLYCTTFPCHNCAKHIIAAGVLRVVYVEPYPKSKALQFHDDSIAKDEEAGQERKVKFEPFVGIGPRRFFDLFSMQLGSSYPLVRKEDTTGKPKSWHIKTAQLRIQMHPTSYLELEEEAVKAFGKHENTLKGKELQHGLEDASSADRPGDQAR